MNEIRAIEEKYGLAVFRMGLTVVVDVGIRRLSDDAPVDEDMRQIAAECEADSANGVTPVMSRDFQRAIISCAAELARFSPWRLFAYIKKYVTIS